MKPERETSRKETFGVDVEQSEGSEKIVGFVVNPIAGMGGAVGLKGTDGKATLRKAVSLGAKPVAQLRARCFLSEFKLTMQNCRFVVGAGCMGEDEARKCGVTYVPVGKRKSATTAEDTIEITKEIYRAQARILVFCGGDGTARDILDAVDTKLPVIGIPTGVKMHSAVFGVTPSAAATVTSMFLQKRVPLREGEVMDVNENDFRNGVLSARLYGYMLTPYEPSLIQGAKMASQRTKRELHNQAAIALHIIEEMEPDVIYILGPGTTTRTVADLLNEKKTLLGVDLFSGKRRVASDVNEKQILQKIKDEAAQIIVSPIGGQGFIFGRGNQQISSTVIRQVGLSNICVVATEGKLAKLRKLRVDTGDSRLDDELRGAMRVTVDYKKEVKMEVA